MQRAALPEQVAQGSPRHVVAVGDPQEFGRGVLVTENGHEVHRRRGRRRDGNLYEATRTPAAQRQPTVGKPVLARVEHLREPPQREAFRKHLRAVDGDPDLPHAPERGVRGALEQPAGVAAAHLHIHQRAGVERRHRAGYPRPP